MDEDDIDDLDDLSVEELSALLEAEEAELDGLAEQSGEIDEIEFTDIDDGGQLDLWQETVEDFGGRFGSPVAKSLKKQIGAGQLGQTVTIDTTAAVPTFPASIVLAEMNLRTPIKVDVTFSTALQREEVVPFSAVDIGDGFVRITWGTVGSFQNAAEIDANQGWVHPFTASFLRVEYIPSTLGPFGHFPLPGGQLRDLTVGAMITPAQGGPQSTITKTYLMPDVVSGGIEGRVPRWAKNVQITFVPVGVASPIWSYQLTDRLFVPVSEFGSNAMASNNPGWQGRAYKWPVPQRAVNSRFNVLNAVDYLSPTAIYELAL